MVVVRTEIPEMRARAFTLIELLVVIAVIALLIGILLPALSGARKTARGVVCQAHMRGLGMSMIAYTVDSKDFLPGPNTSGSDLQNGRPYTAGSATPSQDWDYISPLLGDSMRFPEDQLQKFEQTCMTTLRCPENRVRYTRRFSGPALPIEARGEQPFTLSYMTPAFFMMYPTGITTVAGRSVESVTASEPVRLPRGYRPRIDLVGTLPSMKAMAFEGARYWDTSLNGGRGGFDYSTVTNAAGLVGSPQGNFASRGPAFIGSGEGYIRSGGPTEMFKMISLRHTLKMNVAMFDGHVEQLDDLESANPEHFTPSGSLVQFPPNLWWTSMRPGASPYATAGTIIN
jgi:prepilin-type N-terminal cleavage/methylation domain-containing protein/prepilin-type processing-associated H-X9-DG protein